MHSDFRSKDMYFVGDYYVFDSISKYMYRRMMNAYDQVNNLPRFLVNEDLIHALVR